MPSDVILGETPTGPVQFGMREIIGTPQSTGGAFVVPTTDVSLYRSFSIQATGTINSLLTVRVSNDGQNFDRVYVCGAGANPLYVNTIGDTGIYTAPIYGRYLQVQEVGGNGGATISCILELYTTPIPPLANALLSMVTQSGVWVVTPQVGGVNVAVGNPLPVIIGEGTSTTAIAAGTNTITVVKGSTGRLGKILVTATGTAEMDIFDNASAASGVKIGVVPANAAVGSIYDFGMPAANGIVASASLNNPGVTISWS